MLAQCVWSTLDMSPGRQVQSSQTHGIQTLRGHLMNQFFPGTKMKERLTFEKSVNIHRTTQHHTKERSGHIPHLRENLNSQRAINSNYH
jgi:hypothetical protein